MAPIDHATYVRLPPPPLPEFYMSGGNDATIASLATAKEHDDAVTSTQPIVTGDGVYDGRPTTFIRMSPPVLVVPHAFIPTKDNEVPPLAIYHICRICLRTRSARYHREHPIPVNGLPPPPGICRRCRVTSAEVVQRVTDTVIEGESNDIKLGFITPFVADEDIISNEKMRRMRAEKYLEKIAWKKQEEFEDTARNTRRREDIVFRHVDAPDNANNDYSARKTKVTFTREDANPSDSHKRPLRPPLQNLDNPASSMQVQPSHKPPSRETESWQTKVSRTAKDQKVVTSRHSSTSSSHSAHKAGGDMMKPSQKRVPDSAIRGIAREEVEHYHREKRCPESRASFVRAIARDEIERYRQAERKIESHPNPYAHGNLVPVAKQMQRESDGIDAKPRAGSSSKAKISFRSGKDNLPMDEPSPVAVESPMSGQDRNAHASKRIPKRDTLVRKLSVERHESRSTSAQVSNHAEFKTEQRKPQKASSRRSEQSASIRGHSDKPSELTNNGRASTVLPFVVEVHRREPSRMEDIVEVPEEASLHPQTSKRSSEDQVHSTSSQYRNWWSGTQDTRASTARPGNGSAERDWLSGEPGMAQEAWNSLSSSRPRHEDDWRLGPRLRTIDSRSSRPYDTLGSGGTPRGRAEESTRDSLHSSKPREREGSTKIRTEGTADKTIWPAEADPLSSTLGPNSGRTHSPPYPMSDTPIDRIMRPSEARTEDSMQSRRSKDRSGYDNGKEYFYKERIVRPASGDNEARPLHDLHPARRVEVEEWIETRRYPRAPREDQPSNSQEQGRGRPRNDGRAPSRQHSKRSDASRDSDYTSHVRFSKKVEYSPTPPASDESSSAFRSYHSIRRRSGIGHTDGASSPEHRPEPPGEPEARGRTPSRTSGRRDVDMARESATSLQRALSESPSRERLISALPPDEAQGGGGPYRVLERPSDSMRAEDGRV